MDGKLHRNVEAVQNVASEHQRVLRRIDGVDPPLGEQHAVVKRIPLQIIGCFIVREMLIEVAANLFLPPV